MKEKKCQEYEFPKQLVTFSNKDKNFHEVWYAGRDLCNPPHPFRMILAGPPNSGKSTCIKNIILHANPPFQQIVIVSIDPSYSKEYEDIEHVALSEIPAPDEFPGLKKMLVIIDDMDYGNTTKKKAYNLNRLFGYVSTHKNVSVMMAVQDCIACPTSARRTANFFIFSRSPDIVATANIAKRAGMTSKRLLELFDMCTSHYDTIWLDATENSPAPVRKNCYSIIERRIDDTLEPFSSPQKEQEELYYSDECSKTSSDVEETELQDSI